MILRNSSFSNDLEFRDDRVAVIEVRRPEVFARFVQSMVAMESGDTPVEPFVFLENDKEINPARLLYVVTDPFRLDINNKKNLNALYAYMERCLTIDAEKMEKWYGLMAEASRIVEEVTDTLVSDVEADPDLSLSGYCKSVGMRFAEKTDAMPLERLLHLMDITAEFFREKLLVLCNVGSYLSEQERKELYKYACYTKVRLLVLEAGAPSELDEHETRWIIDTDYDDMIVYG